jgi:hypothetical protein
VNHYPGLASNHDPPDLSLPSTYDYRYEPSEPCWSPGLLCVIPSLIKSHHMLISKFKGKEVKKEMKNIK